MHKILKLLNTYNLEFLGFTNEEAKKKYSIIYPEDSMNINIENWNKFETENPDTFISMYQFWLRKKQKWKKKIILPKVYLHQNTKPE